MKKEFNKRVNTMTKKLKDFKAKWEMRSEIFKFQ